jgi:hypothetical protein
MKKITILVLILVALPLLFSQDSGTTITKDWILIKQKSRSFFEKRKLLELDTQTLDEINNKKFSPDVEDVLSGLLYDIIVYDKLDMPENSLKALDILQNKFSTKKYLFNIAADFSNNYAATNPYVLAKIFSCMKDSIVGNYDENVSTLQIIYQSIKTPYIIEAKNGTVRYGTNTVIKYLKDYLDEFPILLNQGKISSDPNKYETVMRITAEAGI